MIKDTALIIFLMSLHLGAICQCKLEEKTLVALSYIRTNVEVNNGIKTRFPKQTQRKCNYVDLKICEKIYFYSLIHFVDIPGVEEAEIDSVFIEDYSSFKSQYGFAPCENRILGSLNHMPNAELYLSFSKPINNFLIAKISQIEPPYRFGNALMLLFIFDEENRVRRVLTSFIAQN